MSSPAVESVETLKATAVAATPMPTVKGQGVAVYLRISDDRAGAGLGVERQLFDIQPLLERNHPGALTHLYVDNDLSASGKVKRPAYLQLLSDVAAGRVKAILAWHPDRIYRNLSDLQGLILLVDAHDVAITTARAGDLDLTTPAGRLQARMLGSVATYELEHLTERAQAKKAELARDGRPSGGPRMFGYTAGMTALHPTEGPAAQKVLAALLAGASLISQAKWLNEQGLLGSRGAQWSGSSVRSYALRASLAGIRLHKIGSPDQERFEAAWPALITEDQHKRLLAMFTDPSRKQAPGHNTRRHLLTGVAVCGVCGGPCQAATDKASDGTRYGVYRCKTRFCLSREQTRVDGITLRLVAAWLAKQDATGLLTDPRTNADKARLGALVADLGRRLARIEADYDAEALTGAERKAKRAPLVAQQEDAERALLALQAPVTVLDGLVGQEDALALLKALPLARQRAVIGAIGVPVISKGHRSQADTDVVRMRWHERPRV